MGVRFGEITQIGEIIRMAELWFTADSMSDGYMKLIWILIRNAYKSIQVFSAKMKNASLETCKSKVKFSRPYREVWITTIFITKYTCNECREISASIIMLRLYEKTLVWNNL